ncbi:Lrp/AsnC family transcriptional regulator [Plantibacter sp. ME-Dv--P-095]|uniref:Lrp/AsnC family transcriptional regulator n=1 Tax=Plantibacter sp. ME-Dv--P-095 TaxID=3040299 RepID=UPI00254DE1A2|nr:Lrp/AsnC family transcriptional regulator [Plantibacter sp. ME-Dv--P-095]
MDALDEKLLNFLRQDGRASSASIARKLGVAASAVKRRIESLKARGIITGFTVVTSSSQGPIGTEALVEVFCRGNVSTDELRSLLAASPTVVFAASIAGAADAVLLMQADSVGAISAAVEAIRSSPRVERTRTSVVFERL